MGQAVNICQQTFSNVLSTISHSVPLLLTILTFTILMIGFFTLCIQIFKTRVYVKKYLNKRTIIPNEFKKVIKDLNLEEKVDIVEDENKFSFCYGIFKPRICLSAGLLKTLTVNELKAVLLHEIYHLENKDPLKIILGKTISKMFFFIPILKDAQNFYAFSKEIAADEIVIKNNYKDFLVSTLSKLLATNIPRFSDVAALASVDNLERRILYLTNGKKKAVFKASLMSILLSFIMMFSIIIIIPVYTVDAHNESENHSFFICTFGTQRQFTPANYSPTN